MVQALMAKKMAFGTYHCIFVLIIVVLLQSQITSMDRTANVVLDIEGLPQQPDKCCTGSPRMSVCPLIHIIDMSIQ
jgi:hypothetical protein